MTGFQQQVAERLKRLYDDVIDGRFGCDNDFDYDEFIRAIDEANDDLDDIAFEY